MKLFDFDGTLFYGTTDINFQVINLTLADMGRPPITREEANSTVGDKLEDACRRTHAHPGVQRPDGPLHLPHRRPDHQRLLPSGHDP